FLLNREAMRERLIGLLGTARISATTRAMGEASYRVSRYLGTQLIVNAMFGIPFGLALWLIGIPNALLFGLLGMVLRFVPCVAVIGRHIPEFGYFNMLLGTDPVLTPTERFYQRLLALDHEDAARMIQHHARVQGTPRTFDEIIVPALRLAEVDRRKGALEPARERFVYEHMQRIVESLEPPAPANAPGSLCIVAAHDDADHIAALAAAKLFAPSQDCVVGAPALAAEVARTAAERHCPR